MKMITWEQIVKLVYETKFSYLDKKIKISWDLMAKTKKMLQLFKYKLNVHMLENVTRK